MTQFFTFALKKSSQKKQPRLCQVSFSTRRLPKMRGRGGRKIPPLFSPPSFDCAHTPSLSDDMSRALVITAALCVIAVAAAARIPVITGVFSWVTMGEPPLAVCPQNKNKPWSDLSCVWGSLPKKKEKQQQRCSPPPSSSPRFDTCTHRA